MSPESASYIVFNYKKKKNAPKITLTSSFNLVYSISGLQTWDMYKAKSMYLL